MSMGAAVEHAGLGPCDLQDPVWAKMSALAAGVNKKRKKSENKPQAQINKCNNEKRRREQENIYIEELAELISANFADMSSLSVKPDKCAILQEAVNQIRSIKQLDNACQNSDPVQQGEVSSSRPTILSNEVYGPLLLEALEGFLFVVNSEGKVEHVTENVSKYIEFTREEVLGKSIYNFIHHGDHAKFHSNLLPLTIDWGSDQTTASRSKSIDIRLLIKPPDDLDETVEEKQQRVCTYEPMHISSTPLRDQLSISEDDGSDSGPCLLCVASRISHRDKSCCSIEQFTTKLDTTGKIICVDTSGVSDSMSQIIKKDLKNRVLRDLVPPQDVHKINTHLRETLSGGQSTSALYRLHISQDKVIQVQTKSKLFKTNPQATNDTDFIMATHSIVGENDSIGPTDPGGGNTGCLGGPLMTSVVNGTRNNGPPSNRDTPTTPNSILTNIPTSFAPTYLDSEFTFDFAPSTSWELEPRLEPNWSESRPDSRQSVTPVSTPTPRPPSNPSYTSAPTVSQSPIPSYATQPSPTVPNSSTSTNPYNSTFAFSPLGDGYSLEEQKDTKAHVLEEAQSMAESTKLRSLLMNPNDSRDRILKELLNQPDDDKTDNRGGLRGGPPNRGPGQPGPSDPHKSTASSSGNNMLRQLLNEKNDDEDLETKAGVKKKSELLQQLLKKDTDDDDEKKNESQPQEDSLLRSLGFPPGSPEGRGTKRQLDDKDDRDGKRANDGSQVSSSASTSNSDICKKNKMLLSLLAKQPPNLPSIPPIPASIITATPQEKLPRVADLNKNMNTVNHNNIQQNNTRHTSRLVGRPPNNYLNNNLQRHDVTRMNQMASGCYTSPATSTTDNNNFLWDVQNNDPVLSDLLDQVIDFVPDDIMQLLDMSDGQQQNNYPTSMISETMAINIIQKSLMQCESAVKSPSSPSLSMASTPPAYTSSANVTAQNNQSIGYPPPPNYPQGKYQQRMPTRPGAPQYASGTNLTSQQQLILQRKQMLHQQQQQEQKRRLLQQQQQQQLLIPSNATAAEINSIQNIDSLLNNTVAPNVSLQRSASVPESQLSPNYGNQLPQQNQRVNQQPYSPHSQLTSPLGQQNFPQTSVGNYQQQGSRLSPQSQFNSQLSPRQAYPQGNGQNANWQQQRINVQQNPMLNAQLTRPPQQPQSQQSQQQQRSINSPGTVSRHSPFPADQFPPPNSPNSVFNQGQYLRLQRANSVPTTTTHLAGGLGSPRHYSGREHHHHPYPNLPPNPVPPMIYQQDSQYCYDQTNLSLGYNSPDRGRAPPHLQSGVSGSGPTSEFVRQELRAVVGARTAQAQPTPNRGPNQLLNQQQVTDLDALGIGFDMPSDYYGGGPTR